MLTLHARQYDSILTRIVHLIVSIIYKSPCIFVRVPFPQIFRAPKAETVEIIFLIARIFYTSEKNWFDIHNL